ncbi:amino acid racemase [Candidatus Haliotispira prima]|uniref:Amino acid racemase n=1 Tax=Candidatus Haliotispira prima TaxID=3034016 RepID=A0ABY8MJK0_9SPIO|nr:amino acid racemase [Candidatus Haliotispira prima]
MVRKTIGIVGGVGPQAGIDLQSKIIRFTEASKDQEHLSVVHVSFSCQIGDRSEYLLAPESQPNPGEAVYKVIELLFRSGAQVIGIPCNTCHAPPIFDPMRDRVARELGPEIKLLHMIEEVCKVARAGGFHKIGLLATQGSYNSNLYVDIFREQDIEILHPKTEAQCRRVHSSIYDPKFGIKANSGKPDNEFARNILLSEADILVSRGAQAIIMGCTEIPLVLRENELSVPVFDATAILAQALVSQAMD